MKQAAVVADNTGSNPLRAPSKEIPMKKDLPDFSTYFSKRVFDGIRTLTGKEAEETRARMKRALAKLKNKKEQ